MEENKTNLLLIDHYRVLDLTDEKGLLCAKILGDLGADVIKIEKPGGDISRRLGPFFHNNIHPEKSLPPASFIIRAIPCLRARWIAP